MNGLQRAGLILCGIGAVLWFLMVPLAAEQGETAAVCGIIGTGFVLLGMLIFAAGRIAEG
jgi:hypothetical protein